MSRCLDGAPPGSLTANCALGHEWLSTHQDRESLLVDFPRPARSPRALEHIAA